MYVTKTSTVRNLRLNKRLNETSTLKKKKLKILRSRKINKNKEMSKNLKKRESMGDAVIRPNRPKPKPKRFMLRGRHKA